jgi:tRNA (cytidine32/uridine32-2'-O)-methyltransferase
MAMQLVAYEIRMAWLEAGQRMPEPPWDRPWAESAAVEGMLGHLERVLRRVRFLDARDSGQVMMRMRRLFFRTRLDEVEVNILRGLCSAVERRTPEPPGAGAGVGDGAGDGRAGPGQS